MTEQVLPLVAIVGRPNVGKSTLFNRLIGRRRSIVTDEPGLTRDRIYGTCSWSGTDFEVVDTGGIVPGEETEIPRKIFEQAQVAIEHAAALIFVVDGHAAVTASDQDLARLLRLTQKPVFLAVNKIDSEKRASDVAEFYRLGFDRVFPVSAEHGRSINDLLDDLIQVLPKAGLDETAEREIRVAIIGRPNVGKSTLLNRVVGEERSMVSPVAGTTRDAVDSVVHVHDRRFRFIDTAGIRRKGKTDLVAEKLSVVMARKHLEQSDVALLLIDAVDGVTSLDATIGGYAHEAGRSVIIVVNKWDAIDKGPTITADFERQIRERLKFLDYAPVVTLSAKTGRRVQQLFPLIEQVNDARRLRIPTAELNQFLRAEVLARGGLPSDIKVRYITQVKASPPTFVVFVSRSKKMHFSFERFLANQIRARFSFTGTPIIIRQRVRQSEARR